MHETALHRCHNGTPAACEADPLKSGCAPFSSTGTGLFVSSIHFKNCYWLVSFLLIFGSSSILLLNLSLMTMPCLFILSPFGMLEIKVKLSIISFVVCIFYSYNSLYPQILKTLLRCLLEVVVLPFILRLRQTFNCIFPQKGYPLFINPFFPHRTVMSFVVTQVKSTEGRGYVCYCGRHIVNSRFNEKS